MDWCRGVKLPGAFPGRARAAQRAPATARGAGAGGRSGLGGGGGGRVAAEVMARARAISPRAAMAAAHALALGLVLALALALGAACVAARQADYARIDEDAFAAEEAAFFHARTLRQEYAAYPKAAADPSRALLAGVDDAEVTRRIGKGFMDRGSISSYVKAGGPAFNYALQRTGSNLFQTVRAKRMSGRASYE